MQPITIPVHNLMLEGPPQNPTAVSFTGLPHICKGKFERRFIKRIAHLPQLQVVVKVTQAHTRFYGFSRLAGKTIILVKA